MNERIILGLMSGSSLDGVDMAAVRFWGDTTSNLQWELVAKPITIIYPESIKSYLKIVHTLSGEVLNNFHCDMGDFFGKVSKEYIDANQLKISAIASHGHTVLHNPEGGYSLQIGDGLKMAAASGLLCITDFRNQDILAGGQGAPLAPVVEHYLFGDYKMFLNIGGISNISLHVDKDIIAYDICPANQLLNHLANSLDLPFDDKGEIAASGIVDRMLLSSLHHDAYHQLSAPKSLDNNYVRNQFIAKIDNSNISIADKLATCTHYIADNIAEEIASLATTYHVNEILVTGGGAYNTFLLDLLRIKLADVLVVLPKDEIIQHKESILMAICGYLYLEGQPNSFATATGASMDTINGSLHKPQK